MYVLLFAGMVLRKRIAVADVGVLDAVQQHVHAADAQHGVVEVEAVEHAPGGNARASFSSCSIFGMVLAQIFAGRDQEAAGAAGGIADHVLRRAARSSRPSAG